MYSRIKWGGEKWIHFHHLHSTFFTTYTPLLVVLKVGKSKKDKAFELFDKGLDYKSPEVKALGLKGPIRYNYYRYWRIARGIIASPEAIGEATPSKKAKIILPGGESVAPINKVLTCAV